MDYSKLSDEELEAISRSDFSKLPDRVLNQIINSNQVAPGATTRPADPANFNRQAARDAGYTDEEIDAYLRNPQRSETQAGTVGQEAQGVAQILAVPAAAALNYALENPLTTLGGAYGAYKGSQLANAAIDRLRGGPVAPGNLPPAGTPGSPQNPIGSSSGAAPRQIPINAAPPAPVTPATSPILDAQGRPIVRTPVVPTGPAPAGPVAPTSMPPLTAGEPPLRPPVQPSMADRAGNLVRAVAANKVVQNAARLGGIAGIASMLLEPSNAGQNYPFPMSGPLRGSELNPATGRPWTPQELAAYRAQYGR